MSLGVTRQLMDDMRLPQPEDSRMQAVGNGAARY
jgi:hypothetical protein